MMFNPGDRIELHYPTRTHVREIDLCRRVPRRLIVRSVRDLVADPITPADFLRRPYTARSRYLVSAWDLDRQSFRQFYVGSADGHRAPGTLRIATYRPGESRPARILSSGYDANVHERRELIRMLQRIMSQIAADPLPTGETLKIVADDLRRIG